MLQYGFLAGKQLDDVYKLCNIGVGPLAPHRNGGKEGTGIKTKEYFAIGLPYFYAGNELKVPENYPYILKLESNDEPIDIERVLVFYETLKDDRKAQESMRDFARKNFQWDEVFRSAIIMATKE